MQYLPKQYVSAALAHLRHVVTACALTVALASAAQLLVFGCVHFTQIRFIEARHEPSMQPLSVVVAPHRAAVAKDAESAKEPEAGPPLAPTTPGAAPERAPLAPQPLNVAMPAVLSDADATLHTISDLAVISGMLAAVVLGCFVAMGVAVAGGASIPGVQNVVSAAGYAVMLAVACVPWRDLFASVAFPGVFSGYDVMTQFSDHVNGGGSAVPLFTCYLFMPLAAMIAAFMTLARFRDGVAEGIIVTSASELDERLEREMAAIRSRGVTAGIPRTVAALHQAIGETPAETPPPPPAAPSEHPAVTRRAPVPRTGRSWLGRDRRIGETDPGDPLKRPI